MKNNNVVKDAIAALRKARQEKLIQKIFTSRMRIEDEEINPESFENEEMEDMVNDDEDNITISQTLGLVSGTDLLNMNVATIPFLWEGIIPKEGLTALSGTSDVGKSSFLRQLATAVALKQIEFLGRSLMVEHGKVLYFSTEDNKNVTSYLLKKQIDEGVKAGDLRGLDYVFDGENVYRRIEEVLKEQKYDLIIIDAFGDIFRGNMNNIGDVRPFLDKFKNLASKYECAIVFLHHNGKRTENNGPSKNSLIGSQGFEGKMRTVMELSKGGSKGKRTLTIVKGNYVSEDEKEKALELLFNEKQQFIYTGRINASDLKTPNSKFGEVKKLILEYVKQLKAANDKISLDKILKELGKRFDFVPSKGTLHSWLKEDVQSDDNL